MAQSSPSSIRSKVGFSSLLKYTSTTLYVYTTNLKGVAMKKSLFMIALALTLVLPLLQVAQAANTSAGQSMDDSSITAKVKGKIMADKNLDASKIHVNTENGRVLLSGHVDTGAEKARAAEIAQSVNGVRGVENDIRSPSCPVGANWKC